MLRWTLSGRQLDMQRKRERIEPHAGDPCYASHSRQVLQVIGRGSVSITPGQNWHFQIDILPSDQNERWAIAGLRPEKARERKSLQKAEPTGGPDQRRRIAQ